MRLDHLLSKERRHRWAPVGVGGAEPRSHLDGRPVLGWPRVCGVVLEGGTLTSSAAGCGRLLVRPAPEGVGGERGRGWVGVVGTLLGPEGADPVDRGARGCVRVVGGGCCLGSGPSGFSYHSFLVLPVAVAGGWGSAGVVSGGGRLFVENCTVDASIFL